MAAWRITQRAPPYSPAVSAQSVQTSPLHVSAVLPHPCQLTRVNPAPHSHPASAAFCPRNERDGGFPRPTVIVTATGKASGSKPAKSSKGFGAANAPSVSKSGVPQTCACGSRHVYRECCEPYHLGAQVASEVEAALRARFCAFVKGRVPYLLGTFHPSYLAFKYPDLEPAAAAAQLRRDVEAAVKRFTYSGLKILEVRPGAHPDEAFITFRYSSLNKFNPEKNPDGTVKLSTTAERSRFVRDPVPDAGAGTDPGSAARVRPWRFADYELLDYPSWMEEAKQAELRAKGLAAQPASAAGTQ